MELEETLLTTGEAARILERSVERVRDYEREGKLPVQRTRSGQRLFKLSDVERLKKSLKPKRGYK